MVVVAVGIIVAGSGLGYFLSQRGHLGANVAPGVVQTGKEVGLQDTQTFRDAAQGVIQTGGLNGEGTHQLVRDGGPSQTVYLVSSVVELDQFVGKKVEVWGETVKGQKAAWLMDVGRVKMLD